MRRMVIFVVLVLVFGVIRLPIEHELNLEHERAYFSGATLDLALRERIGQMGFIAALSGFRSLVADFLYIQAHDEWEDTRWGKMAFLFNNIVTLQPRAVMFWDMASWHMAWNASHDAIEDPDEPRQAVRLRNQRAYFDLGRDFLARGIQNNPDRYILYERMAILLRDKYEDHCSAAEYFEKAAAFEDAPAYQKRFVAYELAKCPGKEEEAYRRLRELYVKYPDEVKPTMKTLIRELQEELDIPEEQRIYIPPENTME